MFRKWKSQRCRGGNGSSFSDKFLESGIRLPHLRLRPGGIGKSGSQAPALQN